LLHSSGKVPGIFLAREPSAINGFTSVRRVTHLAQILKTRVALVCAVALVGGAWAARTEAAIAAKAS
jgi:hypothetical protein